MTDEQLKYNLSIAKVQLIFDQHELIALLKKRGRKLAKQKWKSADKVDQQINQLIQNPEDDLSTIVSAIMTFNTEFGRN